MNSVALQQGQRARLQLKSESLIYPALAFLSVFFVLPIIWFFIKSAADFDGNFGVMLYRTFTSSLFLAVIWKTVLISLVVTLLALLTAYPIAYTLSRAGSLTRSEEHTSELQSLLRISYAVFCLK